VETLKHRINSYAQQSRKEEAIKRAELMHEAQMESEQMEPTDSATISEEGLEQ
jgi:hypothetical protein